MADSVREEILKNIKTSLENISVANGYRSEIQSVQRWNMNGYNLVDVPCLMIEAGPDDWKPSPYPLITCVFIVSITAWIRQSEDDTDPTDKILNDILADVFQALAVDNTRGGNAEDTNIISTVPIETVEGQPHAGLIIDVEIQYTFLQSDPETPR